MGMFSTDEDCYCRSNNPYEELVLVLRDIFNGKDEDLRKWLNATIERLSNAAIVDEKKEKETERLIEAIHTFNNVFRPSLKYVKRIQTDWFEHDVRWSNRGKSYYAFAVPQSYHELVKLIMYAKRYMHINDCKMTLIEIPECFYNDAISECTYYPDKEYTREKLGLYIVGVPVKVGRNFTVVVHWERTNRTESEKFWDAMWLMVERMKHD